MNSNVIEFDPQLIFRKKRNKAFRIFDKIFDKFIESIADGEGSFRIDADTRVFLTKFVNMCDGINLRDKCIYKEFLLFALEYLHTKTDLLMHIDAHLEYQLIIFADLVLKKDTYYFEYK